MHPRSPGRLGLALALAACGAPSEAALVLRDVATPDGKTYVVDRLVALPSLAPPLLRTGDVCDGVRSGDTLEDTLTVWSDGRARYVFAARRLEAGTPTQHAATPMYGGWKRHTDIGVHYYSDGPGLHLAVKPRNPITGEPANVVPTELRLRTFSDGSLGHLSSIRVTVCGAEMPRVADHPGEVRWRPL